MIIIPIDTDPNTTISSFKREVKKFVDERDWKQFHTPKNLVQALACEASELSQLLLFKEYNRENIKSDKKLLSNISDEIADVFIYLVSLLNTLDLDLSQAFQEKMQKNKIKYSIEEFSNGVYFKK